MNFTRRHFGEDGAAALASSPILSALAQTGAFAADSQRERRGRVFSSGRNMGRLPGAIVPFSDKDLR